MMGFMKDSSKGKATRNEYSVLGREREREIYISPWLQVRITGPRHHLTSSL